MHSTKWEIAIPTGRLPEARAAFRERLVPELNGTPGLVRLLVPVESGHSFGRLDGSGRHIDADGYSMDCYALWETKAIMRANLGRLFTEGTRILGNTPFFSPSGRRGAHYEVLMFRDGGPWFECEGSSFKGCLAATLSLIGRSEICPLTMGYPLIMGFLDRRP